jgi:hypothetical protein
MTAELTFRKLGLVNKLGTDVRADKQRVLPDTTAAEEVIPPKTSPPC